MPSSAPIRGRIGDMIMIWLEALKTSSQSAKTTRLGWGRSVGRGGAKRRAISGGPRQYTTMYTSRPRAPRGAGGSCRLPGAGDVHVALLGRHDHDLEDVHVLGGVDDPADRIG